MSPARVKAQTIAGDEPLPEIDALEGFPHPRFTEAVFGHDAVEQRFAKEWQTGNVHHARLLVGPKGIGKATLAYRIARFVLAGDDQREAGLLGPMGLDVRGDGRTAAQVRALSHPGLLVVRRAWDLKAKRFPTQISVDEVRRLRGFLTHSAEGGAWRVVIVDQADEMTANAANALLKSLEEPPAHCLFLLLSSQPGRLLATIHSRCRRLSMNALGDAPLRQAVDQALAAGAHSPVADPDWPKVVALGEGSVRRALQLVSGGGLDLNDQIEALVATLPRVERGRLVTLAERLSPVAREADYEMFFSLLTQTVAGAVRLAGGQSGQPATPAIARLAALMDDRQKVARWAMLWETLAREKAQADALNLDRKSLIVESVLRLEAAA